MNVTRWCSDCAADATFERVDSTERPEDCVELVCALCGAGFEVGPAQRAPGRKRKGVKPAA